MRISDTLPPLKKKPTPAPQAKERAPAGWEPPRVSDTDLCPLDFAFTRAEPFGGLTPRELQRVVYYHWRHLPDSKRFWLNKGRITSAARLEEKLPKMLEQVPGDYRITGGVHEQILVPDPNSTLCGGAGHNNQPSSRYPSWMNFSTSVPARAIASSCTVAVRLRRPWR